MKVLVVLRTPGHYWRDGDPWGGRQRDKVSGRRDTSSDRSKPLLVALDDDRMAALVQAVRQLQTRLVEEYWGYLRPFEGFPQHMLTR